MTPSHARKRGIKYRYYISSALLQGRAEQAGSVSRVPAAEIEALVARSVRDTSNEPAEIEDAVLIHNHVVRVEVQPDQLVIELAKCQRCRSQAKASDQRHRSARGTRHHQRGAAKFSCPTPDRLKTPARSAPRTAHSWSHRLRGVAAGSTNS